MPPRPGPHPATGALPEARSMHRSRRITPLLILALLSVTVRSQESAPKSRIVSLAETPGLDALLPWRCVGPANMGGRITAISVAATDSSLWYIATASGGLLKTTNNGMSFEHLFDGESTVSIGDVACAPSDPNIVWVGTGEANPRNSVSWGDGVYKSTDGGKTWKNMGLGGSPHTGRIAIHPTNPEIVYVGALGRLWGPNEERGLFKTEDGGKTWKKVLYVDERSGVVEVQMNPSDPETLLVATYERERDGFDSNDPAKKWGSGGGLHKTSDGGKTWKRLTQGLPSGKLGRIGISWYAKNPKLVYAVVESEMMGKEPKDTPYLWASAEDAEVGARISDVREKGPAEKAKLQKGDIVLAVSGDRVLSNKDLRAKIGKHRAGDTVVLEISRDRKSLEIAVELGSRPPAPKGRGRGRRRGASNDDRPHGTRLGGQRPNIQQLQGPDGHEYGGIYRSEDAGESWKRINSLNPRPMYFSQIRVDPSDDQHIWVLGIPVYHSSNGGKDFQPDGARPTHVDHHALWVDPSDGRHLILGNDGGLYVSWDRGHSWDHHNHMAIGQFYDVGVGPKRNYRIFGGLQDNGSWGGPSRVDNGSGPTNGDWMRIGGGDGFVCRVDENDPDLIYYESQNGGTGRRNLRSGEFGRIRPRAPKGKRYRFNWKTPFVLSHHNSRIYYVGGNHLFRSIDRGSRLKKISPELTLTKKGSASAVAESRRDPDLLYVGTTDGALWATRDGGQNWSDLRKSQKPIAKASKTEPKKEKVASASGESQKEKPAIAGAKTPAPKTKSGSALTTFLPNPYWVSSITPSRFETSRVYVSFDGHRSNDTAPYALVSEDYGKTWKSLLQSLPETIGSVRTLREDITNQNILYLGCEFGAWVSIDRGESWISLNTNLPTVAVHEFAQHRSAGEIVAATHGRSLWILDVSALRELATKPLGESPHLFSPKEAIIWRRQPTRGSTLRRFVGQNPQEGASIVYSLPKGVRNLRLQIRGLGGEVLRTLEAKSEAGIHRVAWNLRKDPPKSTRSGGRSRFFRRRGARVKTGDYEVVLDIDGVTLTEKISVRLDPDHPDPAWFNNLRAAEEQGLLDEKNEEEEEEEEDAGRTLLQ